jgi:probable HAF family extracellular repeat protein
MVGAAHARTVRHRRLGLTAATAFGLAMLVTGVSGGTVTPRTDAPETVSTAALTLVSSTADDQPRSPFPGFLLERGKATPIEADDPVVQVFPTGINNRGVIMGEYVRPDVRESGLRRDPDGTITTFDVPGAAGTEATDINDRGIISGAYSEDTPIVNNSARPRGFLLDGRKLTTIEADGAVSTGVNGINNRGQVVGAYTDADGAIHGFRWENGRITTIDIPGAANTALVDINNRGQIVGTTTDETGTTIRGFLWEDGRVTDIRISGAAVIAPQRINERGQIVGYTADDAELTGARGFLLDKGVNGPVTPVDVPGAPRTAPAGLNDRGQIVGLYENPDVPAPRPMG